jgi:hypothetical protein
VLAMSVSTVLMAPPTEVPCMVLQLHLHDMHQRITHDILTCRPRQTRHKMPPMMCTWVCIQHAVH